MRDKLAALWVYLADDFGEVAFKTWAVLNTAFIVGTAGLLAYLLS